jgi:hypothetical protein
MPTHPPDSPDLTLSTFYLFPTKKLGRIQMAEEDKFCESLQEILRSIDQVELNGIFEAWMLQIQEVSQGNGDHIRW